MARQTPSKIGAQLYVRSQAGRASRPEQRQIIERLRRLAADGTLDRFDVYVWGREICLEVTDRETDCFAKTAAKLAEFEHWARDDVSLERTFDRHEVRCEFTGEEYVSVSTPFLCLAIYEDVDLVGVYPCEVGGEHRSVTDGLDGLEERTEPAGRDPPARVTDEPPTSP